MPLDTETIIPIAVFGLVFASWIGFMLVNNLRASVRKKRIEKRLDPVSVYDEEGRVISLWMDDRQESTIVRSHGKRLSIVQRLTQTFAEAGLSLNGGVVVLGFLSIAIAATAASFLIGGNPIPGLALGATPPMLFWFFLQHKLSRRQAMFEIQFVDALDLAARSLRAGHPLVGSFQLIAEEIAAPVSTVFAQICQQQALGSSIEEALTLISERSSSKDLQLFATSVIIQVRSGGNLADMMERLAAVIRERRRLSRRLRVLTAQTQFSKRALLALPFVIFLGLNLLDPTYMVPLYTTSAGQFLLLIGGTGLVLGGWMMNRIGVLRY